MSKFDDIMAEALGTLNKTSTPQGKPGDGRLSPEEEQAVRSKAQSGDTEAQNIVAKLDKKAELAKKDAKKSVS